MPVKKIQANIKKTEKPKVNTTSKTKKALTNKKATKEVKKTVSKPKTISKSKKETNKPKNSAKIEKKVTKSNKISKTVNKENSKKIVKKEAVKVMKKTETKANFDLSTLNLSELINVYTDITDFVVFLDEKEIIQDEKVK